MYALYDFQDCKGPGISSGKSPFTVAVQLGLSLISASTWFMTFSKMISILVRRSCSRQGVRSRAAPQTSHVSALAIVTVSFVRTLVIFPLTSLPFPLLPGLDLAVSSLSVCEEGRLEYFSYPLLPCLYYNTAFFDLVIRPAIDFFGVRHHLSRCTSGPGDFEAETSFPYHLVFSQTTS